MLKRLKISRLNKCKNLYYRKFLKLFPLTIFFFLTGIKVVGYESTIELDWIKNVNNSNPTYFDKSIETSLGEIVSVGNMQKTDLSGASINAAIIAKHDINGNQVWLKSLDGSASSYFYAVVETDNKKLIAVGTSSSTDSGFTHKGSGDAILVQYDMDGNQEWIKNFGGAKEDIFYGIVNMNDGGFIAVGHSYSTELGFTNKGRADVVIVKFDSDGDKVWAKNFGGSYADRARAAIKTMDGGVVVIGWSYSDDIEGLDSYSTTSFCDAVIVKFDKYGNQLWVNNFSGSNLDYFYAVTEDKDGNIFAVGCSKSDDAGFENKGENDAIIVKFNSNGKKLSMITFGGSSDEYWYSATSIYNGDIVVAGCSKSNDLEFQNNGEIDIIMIIYDNELNQKMIRSVGGSSNDYVRTILQLNDGDLMMSGYTNSSDIENVKLSSECDAIIVKYSVDYLFPLESDSQKVVSYIIPTNALKLSLSTNQIIFDNFSYTESLEKKNVLEIVVSSTLPYTITTSIEGDIVGITYGQILDKSIIGIKSSSDSAYKNFSNDLTTFELFSNQPATEEMIHSIDIKLMANKLKKVDVYKTIFKFEVKQI